MTILGIEKNNCIFTFHSRYDCSQNQITFTRNKNVFAQRGSWGSGPHCCL